MSRSCGNVSGARMSAFEAASGPLLELKERLVDQFSDLAKTRDEAVYALAAEYANSRDVSEATLVKLSTLFPAPCCKANWLQYSEAMCMLSSYVQKEPYPCCSLFTRVVQDLARKFGYAYSRSEQLSIDELRKVVLKALKTINYWVFRERYLKEVRAQ